jgi:NADP-dependent 3-hydroxy acid dehydrogenase YdfG
MTTTAVDTEPRTAIVTGASSGLGVAMAVALGELGWRVAIGARRVDRLQQTAQLVEQAGGSGFAHALDLADPDSVERFFDATEEAFGVADVVVNNAGMSKPGPVHERGVEEIQYEVAVNLLGPMYMVRRALPPMLERGRGGDIVFVTSDAAVHPRPRQAIYTANKTGLEGFSRALAMELEGSGIRATIVRPGPAASEYAADWDMTNIVELIQFWQHFGLQRHGGIMPPEAVARAVVTAVTTPAGVYFDTLEVQPEAPRSD